MSESNNPDDNGSGPNNMGNNGSRPSSPDANGSGPNNNGSGSNDPGNNRDGPTEGWRQLKRKHSDADDDESLGALARANPWKQDGTLERDKLVDIKGRPYRELYPGETPEAKCILCESVQDYVNQFNDRRYKVHSCGHLEELDEVDPCHYCVRKDEGRRSPDSPMGPPQEGDSDYISETENTNVNKDSNENNSSNEHKLSYRPK